MEEKKLCLWGLNIKQLLCMAACVVISGIVLVFGEHDMEEEAGLVVDAKYEAVDGDLDFGNLMGEGTKEEGNAGTKPTPTAVPTATPQATLSPEPDGTEEVTEYEDEHFIYTIEDGVAVLTVCKDTALKRAVIPVTVDGFPLEIIGEYAFQNCSALEQITFPEGLKTIRWNAFENCTSLKAVEFPASLVTINECAFWNAGLTELTLPGTVRVLEDYAFYACENLKKLTLGTTANLSMIFDMAIVTQVTLTEGVITVEEDAFAYATELREVNLPSTLTMIKPYAFWECTALEKLELPDSVAAIGENAFENCSSLHEVELPENLLLLSEYAFYNCEALERVTVPDGITTIQPSAFEGCEKLVLEVGAGSVGEEYAVENEILYEIRAE